jgi:hypothetical protein
VPTNEDGADVTPQWREGGRGRHDSHRRTDGAITARR